MARGYQTLIDFILFFFCNNETHSRGKLELNVVYSPVLFVHRLNRYSTWNKALSDIDSTKF